MRVCPHCRLVYSAPLPWCGLDRTPLVEVEVDPLVGTRIDRYEITGLIGTGGTGRVYRGRHAILGRECAVKVLYGEYASEPKFVERFRREAKAVCEIRHPNIVGVEDFGRTPEGLLFLVMEFVPGETLEALLDRQGHLSPEWAATILRDVLKGLEAAHDRGFVHRDVKPQNILIREDGLAKLLDFGTVSIPTNHRLTSIGHIVGTPAYMAPEQTGDDPITPQADLYSLGVVLHEMLTGRLPFTGRNRAEVLIKHVTQPVPPVPPSLGLGDLVRELMEKTTTARPASAAEVLARLEDLDLGEGMAAATTADAPLMRTSDPFDQDTDASWLEADEDRTQRQPVPSALIDAGLALTPSDADAPSPAPSSPWSDDVSMPGRWVASADPRAYPRARPPAPAVSATTQVVPDPDPPPVQPVESAPSSLPITDSKPPSPTEPQGRSGFRWTWLAAAGALALMLGLGFAVLSGGEEPQIKVVNPSP
ncbi:MAG: serine/threonine-protein kinase [Myxococcota bacterium]